MAQASSSNEATTSPPPERSRREGNDSLWKRARRTLGTNSLTFLQPQSRPAGKSQTLFHRMTLCRVCAMYSNLIYSIVFWRQCRHDLVQWASRKSSTDAEIMLTLIVLGTTTSASSSGPAAPSKRREQVRHAQRYVFSFVLR